MGVFKPLIMFITGCEQDSFFIPIGREQRLEQLFVTTSRNMRDAHSNLLIRSCLHDGLAIS